MHFETANKIIQFLIHIFKEYQKSKHIKNKLSGVNVLLKFLQY